MKLFVPADDLPLRAQAQRVAERERRPEWAVVGQGPALQTVAGEATGVLALALVGRWPSFPRRRGLRGHALNNKNCTICVIHARMIALGRTLV